MSATEQLELDIIVKISTGLIPREEGQKILNVSERTLRRHLKAYIEQGPMYVKHGNYKADPVNRSNDPLKQAVLKLVREKYFDFNMSHCLEKLEACEGIVIKRETFRKWCHEVGMVKHAKRRRGKVRKRRERMQQAGLMLQMDGSPHAWFGGKPSCLIGAIDDASSEVPFAEFFPAEDTISCMRVLQKIIEKKGVFHILYVDKAGIFGGQKRAHFSQVKRALKELDIHIIFANSPEAKGRIERLWQTLQDRLIPEMRIRNIRSYDAANDYLQAQFLPNEYEGKFTVTPSNLVPAYRELPVGIDLREIFCIKEHRQVKRDHTLSWNNEIYLIQSGLKHSIYKQKIEIRTYQDLSWRAFFAGKPIEITLVTEHKKSASKAPVTPLSCDVIDLRAEKVRMDGLVPYLNRYYSVAEIHVGKKVSIREVDSQVQIYLNRKLIESHPKLSAQSTGNSIKSEHLAPWKRALEKTSMYRRAALQLGVNVDRFIVMILERGHGFIDTATLWGILNLDKTYEPACIDEACVTAIALETMSYRAVKMLVALIGTRHERRAVAALRG